MLVMADHQLGIDVELLPTTIPIKLKMATHQIAAIEAEVLRQDDFPHVRAHRCCLADSVRIADDHRTRWQQGIGPLPHGDEGIGQYSLHQFQVFGFLLDTLALFALLSDLSPVEVVHLETVDVEAFLLQLPIKEQGRICPRADLLME